MRKSVAVTIKAGVALSLLIGFDKVALDSPAPSSSAVIQRRGDDSTRSGRRGRRRTVATTVATTVGTTPTSSPASTATTIDHTTHPSAPASSNPASSSPASSSPASSAPVTAPATTAATTAPPAGGTTTTAHAHVPTGNFPTVWSPSAGPRNGEAFVENFDADPLSPQAFKPDNWDIQYHSRDIGTWETPEATKGHNSDTCGSAPAHHAITSWAASTYVCLHHLMTAVEAGGYGVIYMTPPAMVDLSSEGTISWGNSTLLTSNRDWEDVWISPYATNLSLPLADYLPDLQGDPQTAVQVTRDFGTSKWLVNVVRNHVSTTIASLTEPADLPRTQAGTTAYEIRLSRTGITFGLPERNLWTSASFADLGFSAGVVQFGHHSYNPRKDGGSNYANSWSWDSFKISPTKPLAITTATPRIVQQSGGTVTFPAAPANARLRFSGICSIEMNTGGGWQKATAQPEERHQPEHFSSYFVPIPKGATQATFRFAADGWYSGFPCAVKDAHVWTAG